MALVKWSPLSDPWEEFEKILAEWPGYSRAQAFVPAVDVYQDDNNVIVEMPLPGVDIKNVNLSVENDVLTVEGRKEQKREIDEKNYYRREVRYGSFHRSIALPTAVNGNKAKAEYKDGVLKVVIPKEERAKPKKITIKTVNK